MNADTVGKWIACFIIAADYKIHGAKLSIFRELSPKLITERCIQITDGTKKRHDGRPVIYNNVEKRVFYLLF